MDDLGVAETTPKPLEGGRPPLFDQRGWPSNPLMIGLEGSNHPMTIWCGLATLKSRNEGGQVTPNWPWIVSATHLWPFGGDLATPSSTREDGRTTLMAKWVWVWFQLTPLVHLGVAMPLGVVMPPPIFFSF